MDFYGFKPFRPHGRPVFAEEIARLLRSQIKPKVIFWRCVDVLIREKIEVPGYFPLARISQFPCEMRTECRHSSGLAAKDFAPASCSPSSLRRVNISQV